jgi:uncharacterized protein (DUF1697 family)
MSAAGRERYVALLRGINVGGKHVIAMAALRAAFEATGFTDVTTYIQSGNVLFMTRERSGGAQRLARQIEKALSAELGYAGVVVVRSQAQMREVLTKAPRGFGRAPDRYRYDVLFLQEPLDAAEALSAISLREGVDTACAGDGVIYFSRLISRVTQSHLPRIVSLPIYKQVTVRNWNTTVRLVELMARSTVWAARS